MSTVVSVRTWTAEVRLSGLPVTVWSAGCVFAAVVLRGLAAGLHWQGRRHERHSLTGTGKTGAQIPLRCQLLPVGVPQLLPRIWHTPLPGPRWLPGALMQPCPSCRSTEHHHLVIQNSVACSYLQLLGHKSLGLRAWDASSS